MKKRILSLALALVLLSSAVPAGAARSPVAPFIEDAAVDARHGAVYVSYPHSLVLGLGVMGGDESGNMHWGTTLTRAEAATMLVRLMNAEEEAQSLKGAASPFTDVPTWANGYVNYAYEHKVVQGVGGGLFGPERICSAPEFLTMLYRLTDLVEGKDYRYDTVIDDFLADVDEFSARRDVSTTYRYLDLTQIFGIAVKTQDFTREMAAASIFRMMNITAEAGGATFADLLAYRYGLSDTVLYDCEVRRTGWEMAQEKTHSVWMDSVGTINFSLKDGTLYLDSPADLTLTFTLDGETDGDYTITGGKPFRLPDGRDCQLTLSYFEEDASYFHTAVLFICWRDGQAGFQLYPGGANNYDLYYAVGENGIQQRNQAYSEKNPPGWEPTEEMRTLAAGLTAGKSTERAKAEAICTWVAEHIYYDYDEYVDGNASYVDIMVSRRGVCADYTALTELLMRAAGLKCYYEASYNHAWNAAFLDGEWVMIDNTWDSKLKYRHGVYMLDDPTKPAREDITEDALRTSYPVDNLLEPGATSEHKYFGMLPWAFYTGYSDHTPERRPELYEDVVPRTLEK